VNGDKPEVSQGTFQPRLCGSAGGIIEPVAKAFHFTGDPLGWWLGPGIDPQLTGYRGPDNLGRENLIFDEAGFQYLAGETVEKLSLLPHKSNVLEVLGQKGVS
jgi:hypothetical protein